jgi:hypothetical protein
VVYGRIGAADVVLLGEVLKLRWRGPTPPLRVTLGERGALYLRATSGRPPLHVTREPEVAKDYAGSFAGGKMDELTLLAREEKCSPTARRTWNVFALFLKISNHEPERRHGSLRHGTLFKPTANQTGRQERVSRERAPRGGRAALPRRYVLRGVNGGPASCAVGQDQAWACP